MPRLFVKSRARQSAVISLMIVMGVVAAGSLIPSLTLSDTPRIAEAANRRRPKTSNSPYVVFGYNDLGMHCMNEDFSEICILPPFNTLHAQIIQRGEEPKIVTQGVRVGYSIPGNTDSTSKTNFWDYDVDLFGINLPPNVGLTGNGLAGGMLPTGHGDWSATGIPITPLTDKGVNDPFQLANVQVADSRGRKLADTVAVVPVSWEIACNLCHGTAASNFADTAADILADHDRLHYIEDPENPGHQYKLTEHKPVLCAGCHADPALGSVGMPGVSAFSHAMHGAHASRMQAVPFLQNTCYACHPGVQTECQRDVHLSAGVTCITCHGDMRAVANPSRVPWVDEPSCASCHSILNPKFEYEEPGKPFKDSKGHGGVYCAVCHGPQHAVGPAVTDPDNAQAILKQGHSGTITKCTVCHTKTPEDKFFHSRSEHGGEDDD